MQKIRWGIIGCGSIANKFITSMAVVADGEIAACASQTPGKAQQLAEKHGIAAYYNSYAEMLASANIDAVYVATTHNLHHANVLLCLEHGKAVLCEKPLAVSAVQAREMAETACNKKLFLMEAMWTRFLPAIQQMKAWLHANEIGNVKMLRATFGIGANFNAAHRLFNPALAGGALLDAGIYPVSFASYVMGEQPQTVRALADIGQTGVDEQSIYAFLYTDARMAMLSSTVSSASESRVEIVGTEGRIIIPSMFLAAQDVELHRKNGETLALHLPFQGAAGFAFEIRAVHQALLAGNRECAEMPLDESVAIAETMDRIQEQF